MLYKERCKFFELSSKRANYHRRKSSNNISLTKIYMKCERKIAWKNKTPEKSLFTVFELFTKHTT